MLHCCCIHFITKNFGGVNLDDVYCQFTIQEIMHFLFFASERYIIFLLLPDWLMEMNISRFEYSQCSIWTIIIASAFYFQEKIVTWLNSGSGYALFKFFNQQLARICWSSSLLTSSHWWLQKIFSFENA